MSVNQCWIAIEDSAGVRYGAGPIFRVISWSNTARLSKAGKIAFSVAAADPNVSALAVKRIARCYAILDGAVTEIGAGIIDRIQAQATDNGVILACEGDDLLRELTYRSVHDLDLYTETLITPSAVWRYDSGSWLNLPDCYDGNFTNADPVDLNQSNSFLYIGGTTHYNTIYTHQGTTDFNAVAAQLNYGFSDGANNWSELDIQYDTAVVGGTPWPAGNNGGTAVTTFRRNGAWVTETLATTVGTVTAYWVRIDPTQDLDLVQVEEFVLGHRAVKVDDVGAIMAYAPPGWESWSAGTVNPGVYAATTNGTYAEFAGETVLAALIKLAENSGENFRLGPNRQLHWLRSPDQSSGIVAVPNTGNQRLAHNPYVAVITNLEQGRDTYDLVTRVYPYGAGNGEARVTLVNATYSPPAGYTLSTTDNYVQSTAGTATYGRIDRVLSFKDVHVDAFDTPEACNALAQTAIAWLQRHDTPQEFYQLTVAGLEDVLQVGDTIRVVYREARDGVATLAIDGTFIILSATHTLTNGKLHTVALDIGTSDRWPLTDAEIVADTLANGTIYEAHEQPVESGMVKGGATTRSVTATAGVIDHGLLAGLGDDDHSQYLLASDATSRVAFAANWTDLTDAGATTLHKHDHGNLDGLADDDHTQYLNTTRHAGTAYHGTASVDHGLIAGLADDDHTQYLKLAGRTGGQTAYGDTASGGNLVLHSTSNATKGTVDVRGNLKITNATNAATITFAGAGGAGSTITPSGAIVVNLATNSTFNIYSSGSAVWFVAYDASGVVVNEAGDAAADFRVESDTEANMIFVDASADTVQLGGTTNGVKIEKGGNLTLLGTATAWEDVRVEPIIRSASANSPSFSQWFTDGSGSRGVYIYTFDNAVVAGQKEVHFTVQLPHAWAQTAIHMHVHWIASTTAASSKVRWGLEYTWAEPGAAFGNTALVYADTVEGGATGTTQYLHEITEFAALTPSASQDGFSSIMVCRLWRDSANAADTYTGDAGLLYIDAHYEVNKFGSNTEYA